MTSENESLLDKLKNKRPEKIARRVEEVEHLEPEEYERRKRAADFVAEKHWRTKVAPCINWLKFGAIVVSVILFASFLTFLVCSYLLALCRR